MDGDSGLNIMYVKTLDVMGIDRTHICPIRAPFHGVVPGKQAMPLRQTGLPVTFGDRVNYRTETLTFEVVGFLRTFHAILGCPCCTKFMAIINYTYLKLKMSGPGGVITVGTSFQRAYECEVECCGHAMTIFAFEELAALKEEVAEGAPDAKRSTGSFELAEGSKEVLIDPRTPRAPSSTNVEHHVGNCGALPGASRDFTIIINHDLNNSTPARASRDYAIIISRNPNNGVWAGGVSH
ncbi:uncharacterized protein [Miscanthus floridulus]|uniref:uncharacterized protein n=1 Tax=Miscanthus floridulus TaxID=154761 RepID=UPI003458129B